MNAKQKPQLILNRYEQLNRESPLPVPAAKPRTAIGCDRPQVLYWLVLFAWAAHSAAVELYAIVYYQ